MTYSAVLTSVLLGHFFPIDNILLHGRIDNEFLTNRVTSKLPGELVLPANLVLVIFGVEDIVVVLIELSVIMLDDIADGLHVYSRGREVQVTESWLYCFHRELKGTGESCSLNDTRCKHGEMQKIREEIVDYIVDEGGYSS